MVVKVNVFVDRSASQMYPPFSSMLKVNSIGTKVTGLALIKADHRPATIATTTFKVTEGSVIDVQLVTAQDPLPCRYCLLAKAAKPFIPAQSPLALQRHCDVHSIAGCHRINDVKVESDILKRQRVGPSGRRANQAHRQNHRDNH